MVGLGTRFQAMLRRHVWLSKVTWVWPGKVRLESQPRTCDLAVITGLDHGNSHLPNKKSVNWFFVYSRKLKSRKN